MLDRSRKRSSPLRSVWPGADIPDNPGNCSPAFLDLGKAAASLNDIPAVFARFPLRSRKQATPPPHAAPPSQIRFQSALFPSAPIAPSVHLSGDHRKMSSDDRPPPLSPLGKPFRLPPPPTLSPLSAPHVPPSPKIVLPHVSPGTSPKQWRANRSPPWPSSLHICGSLRSTRTYPRLPPPPERARFGRTATTWPSVNAHSRKSPGSLLRTAPSIAGRYRGSTTAASTWAGIDSF